MSSIPFPLVMPGLVNTKTRSPVLSFFRWIAVLPASFAGAILAYIFLQISFTSVGARSIPVFDDMVAMGVSGFAFVVAGAITAPSGKKVWAVILLVVFSLFSGMTAFVGLGQMDSNPEAAIGLAGVLVGVVGAAIGFFVAISMDEKNEANI